MIIQSIFSRFIGKLIAVAVGTFLAAASAQAQDCSCYGTGASVSGNGCVYRQGQNQYGFGSFCSAQSSSQGGIRSKILSMSIIESTYMAVMNSAINNSNLGSDDTSFGLFTRNGIIPGAPSGASGGASHLGMYSTPSPAPATVSLYGVGGGGGSVSHGSGFGINDTAGLIAPGTTTPTFHDEGGGGGVKGIADLGRYLALPNNQDLVVTGVFEYRHDNIGIGSVTGSALAALSPTNSSSRLDAYRLAGFFTYNIDKIYLEGTGAVAFGRGSETVSIDSSTGSFNAINGQGDLRLGEQFVLFNTIGEGTPGLVTKGPLLPPVQQGYSLGLDVSGHLGYTSTTIGGFVDSSGFVFGDSQLKYGDFGGRAKLFAVVPSNNLFWSPFVAGLIDQRFAFQSSLNIPVQTALPTGDTTYIHEANTFYGAQLGLDVRNSANNWTFGVKGFVYASSDQNSVGGSAYVKIPLWEPPPPAPRLIAKY